MVAMLLAGIFIRTKLLVRFDLLFLGLTLLGTFTTSVATGSYLVLVDSLLYRLQYDFIFNFPEFFKLFLHLCLFLLVLQD